MILLAVLLLALQAGIGLAQVQPANTAKVQIAGEPPPVFPLPPPGEKLPSFVESLSTKDGTYQVLVGQGRLMTLSQDLAEAGKPSPLVATGDPTVIEFEVIGPRHIRITGLRIGTTDLSIVTADRESYSMEIRVVPDLEVLAARLRAAFPDAMVELASLRQHVVVEGQARDVRQVAQIVQLVEAYLETVQPVRAAGRGSSAQVPARAPHRGPIAPQEEADLDAESAVGSPLQFEVLPESPRQTSSFPTGASEVINLLRIPGPQQVLLKVQVAELNRTAFRQLGTSFLAQNSTGAIGSTVGPPFPPSIAGGAGLLGLLDPIAGATSTAFGVLDSGNVNLFINALRRNQVLTILAEPNLVALHGQEANFLAGGEFPVPVPQPGVAGLVTIEYRSFGVGLTFVPHILDGGTIRLAVAPEVSSIDFASGVTIQGTSVPGLATRRTSTVVQLSEGQTLAISGILQVELDGTTSRVPGLGDLPYIGAIFRNNSTQTVEKELVVLVTPYLVEPMTQEQVPPLPGQEVLEPDDDEFYLKGRIEKRSWRPYRATAAWSDPLGMERQRQVECRYVSGPYGYSE